ncbi:MAG: hypothetical protein LBL16_05025 [Endomicrobium sp.]|nr:hypothetical protein [Endomicrobium sp.]
MGRQGKRSFSIGNSLKLPNNSLKLPNLLQIITNNLTGQGQFVATACPCQKETEKTNNNGFPMKEEATNLFLQRESLAGKMGNTPTSAEYPEAQTTLTATTLGGVPPPRPPFAPKGAETNPSI